MAWDTSPTWQGISTEADFLRVDGTRPLSSSWDVGGQDISNVGAVSATTASVGGNAVLDTSHLAWTSSGHTGTAWALASFDGSGNTTATMPATSPTAWGLVQADASATIDEGWLPTAFPRMEHRVKTVDTARSSTTTLADDPHLAGLVLEANTRYAVEAFLRYQSSTTADLAFNLQVPAGASFWAWAQGTAPIGSSVLNGGGSATPDGTGYDEIVRVTGEVLVGATAGVLDFQWAQKTSQGTNTIVRSGSWLRATRL